jgi:hypothetical protein
MKQTMTKLHLGCGQRILEGFLNLDLIHRLPDVSSTNYLPWDLSAGRLPTPESSCSLVYSEHFFEHLELFQAEDLLRACYATLSTGGLIRTVIPDFQKAFRSYVDDSDDYLFTFKKHLDKDFEYYESMLTSPYSSLLSRAPGDLPPSWHYDGSIASMNKLRARARRYNSKIDILAWIIYQYGEHKSIYDFDSFALLLSNAGFSNIYRSSFDECLDSSNYMPGTSIYINAYK